jgi:hypothetical protein
VLSPTDPVVSGFLSRTMIAEVGTISPKRRPFLTPLWFVVDGGVLYATTGPETRAGKNIAQEPRVALLFDGGSRREAGGVLRMWGMATCHRGLPSWRVLVRAAAKYYVSPGALPVELRNARRWRLRRLYYGQLKGGFGYIRVVPTGGELLPRP